MGFCDARFGAFLFTRHALLAGRCAASFTTLGIGVGSIIWALVSVLGIAVLHKRSVVVFTVWKFVGAAYLGYLGMGSLIANFRRNK